MYNTISTFFIARVKKARRKSTNKQKRKQTEKIINESVNIYFVYLELTNKFGSGFA